MKTTTLLSLLIFGACAAHAADDLDALLRERKSAKAAATTPASTPTPTPARESPTTKPTPRPTAKPKAAAALRAATPTKTPGDVIKPGDRLRGRFSSNGFIKENFSRDLDGRPYRIYYTAPDGKGRVFYIAGWLPSLRRLPLELSEVRVISNGFLGYIPIEPIR